MIAHNRRRPQARVLITAALSLPLLWGACGGGGGEEDGGEPCALSPSDRYPAKVIDSRATGDENENTDPAAAQGAPDCAAGQPNDLALGKGHVIFDLGCPMESHPGPEIRVWESDGSYCQAIAESYEVFFSEDNSAYTRVGEGFGVSEFDAGAMARFRFIKITAARGIEGGSSPGPDIDAIEVLF